MAITPIPNGDFELGNVDWTLSGTCTIVNEPQLFGAWCARTQGAGEANDGFCQSTTKFPVIPGQTITLTAAAKMAAGTFGTSVAVALTWYDVNGNWVGTSEGPQTNRGAAGANVITVSVTASAPPNAVSVSPTGVMNTSASATVSTIYMDNFTWNYENLRNVTLTSPGNGSNYASGAIIPLRVAYAGDAPTSVEYQATDALLNPFSLGTSTTAPFAVNYTNVLAEGTYDVVAIATYPGYTVTSTANVITVGPPVPPTTREYNASNAGTYLVADNFNSLASAIPATALVTGILLHVDYTMQVLIRSEDEGVPITQANPDVLFSIAPSGVLEAALLSSDDGTVYDRTGTTVQNTINLVRSDFTTTEDGTAQGKRWTVMSGTPATIVVGSETELYGSDPITLTDFLERKIGLRFYLNPGSVPTEAADGDACVRFLINRIRLQAYFDAGSVEYFFASPDKTQVIKGRLAAAYIDDGALRNGDASGIMQLTSDLEVVLGTARTIEANWTIHSGFPPTDANQIGLVSDTMSYNGLPSYYDVEINRSRYQFISANFYGDLTYDSIYGVNGVGRAFSYNSDFFYKIHTQPNAEKDKPRHVEFYHTHLALGYGEGRVDVSVIGEPYNFNGLDGASSWAIGDAVTGLQTLSGTMLGIFGRKSIHGLAGTTVDNFATTVLSPKIGAVEYTVTDMGFPVYANAYGIYTLAQTAEYGDYLGSPMSQDVSPWLRPRLIRKNTSPREVVVAWPVRAKNQYRLAFADGYVLTMTMNNGTQQAPTFSQQKYFVDTEGVVPLLEYNAMVPAAISSELDDGGEERIHIAPKQPIPSSD